jgi:glyoxylase I family protein
MTKETRRGLLATAARALSVAGGAVLGGAALFGARPAAAQEAATAEPVKLLQIGLCVSDLDRSVKFYTEALGFKVEGNRVPIPKALGKLLEMPADFDMTIQFVSKNGVRLELISFKNPAVKSEGKRAMNQAGLTHIALQVTDFDATVAAIKKLGGTAADATMLNAGPAKYMFCTDPDGTRLEITMPPPPKS